MFYRICERSNFRKKIVTIVVYTKIDMNYTILRGKKISAPDRTGTWSGAPEQFFFGKHRTAPENTGKFQCIGILVPADVATNYKSF